MVILSWFYVHYGKLPLLTNALYVLKPAVLGIIAAGIIKLGRAAIRNFFWQFCWSARLWECVLPGLTSC